MRKEKLKEKIHEEIVCTGLYIFASIISFVGYVIYVSVAVDIDIFVISVIAVITVYFVIKAGRGNRKLKQMIKRYKDTYCEGNS